MKQNEKTGGKFLLSFNSPGTLKNSHKAILKEYQQYIKKNSNKQQTTCKRIKKPGS